MADGIKIDTSVQIDWYTLGQSLARKSSPEQSAFFDGFSAGVHAFGSIDAYTQIEYITEGVHGYTAWLVEEMHSRLTTRLALNRTTPATAPEPTETNGEQR